MIFLWLAWSASWPRWCRLAAQACLRAINNSQLSPMQHVFMPNFDSGLSSPARNAALVDAMRNKFGDQTTSRRL